ncbi:hypothetical protein [Ancylomarina sp. 16SWW S1-10-2]|uniref:hypothetical protein n=1 Tax=Ancylomarina sp. 16SWW S1-10-2 TaxID=2499681 RepID=UPI0012AEA74F|nr:hypothetical protein [Ancylomarina sp. 16SWW S1-10-2]MRT93071.1 hypothetical protein [Ancylomarina sp. 16SWW S1-10-2]
MRTIILKYTRFAFFILVLTLFSNHSYAQERCIVKGDVTVDGGDLDNVKITLYKDSEQVSVKSVPKNGKFSYTLNFGYDFIFEFSKEDFVTKRVSVSTYVPQDVLERDSRFPPCKFSIELFRFFPGIDLSIFDQPIGVIMYNNETDLIETDLSFLTDIEDELKRIEEETRLKQKAYLAEKARIKAAYNLAIKKGDIEFQKKSYADSKSYYNEALMLRPYEVYPKDQISKINNLLLNQEGQLEAQRLIDEKYNGLIELADKDFAIANYEQAKVNYNAAIQVKQAERYPKDQLAKITKIELDLRLKKENESNRLAAEKALQEKYDAFIVSADNAFDLKEYEAAKVQYTLALKLKSEELYPQEQIQIINDKLDYQRQLTAANAQFIAEQKALVAEYNKIIELADNQFKKKDYLTSLASYKKALELAVDDVYPQTQIQAINDVIAREKEMAANKLKQKEIDKKYKSLIISGNKQFKSKEYIQSKQNYTDALGLKPNETYPKAQLLKIESLLSRQAKLIAEKEAQEKKYLELVALADSGMNIEAFEKALSNYQQALLIKPKVAYLKDQIEKAKQGLLDKKQEQEEKAKLELAKQQLEKKYAALIVKGDNSLAAKKYYDSREYYKAALDIKPNEKYPKDQFNKLEELMAEELHQASAIKEFEAKYKEFIEKGESQFGSKEYELAYKSFMSASKMKPDAKYPKEQIQKLEGFIAEANRIKADRKLLDDKYLALIGLADGEFKAEKYVAAIENYQSALDLKSKESYPKEQIKLANLKLDELDRLAKEKEKEEQENRLIEEKYQNAIAVADEAFNNKTYKSARSDYKKALEFKPGDLYATAKLSKIRDIIAENDKKLKAAELLSKKKALLNKKFGAFISEGDNWFQNKEYAKSITAYESALQIIRSDEYALKQIDLANEELAKLKQDEANQLALIKEYEGYISSADKLFAEKDWVSAKDKYQSAIDLNYKKSYPKAQIKIIDVAIANNDKLNRQHNLLEKEFEKALAAADTHFKKQSYSIARFHYKEAEEIKPQDAYVKSQLREIEMIFKAKKQSEEDELLAKNSNAFRENLLKKKEKEYKAFITKADVAIKDRYLSKAKAYYEKALGVFDRDYPREKLSEIKELRFAFKSEKDRKAYNSFMQSGEKEFEKNNYSVSRYYYKKALALATDRSIIEDKLNEIEEAIDKDKTDALDLEYKDLVNKGNSAFKSGDLSVAKFYFIKALKIKPNDTQMKENLESIKNSLK